jgi:peptide/nickel transport system substrate-binding protein
LGIWLVDQWRQIGLNVKMEMIEASAYHPMLKRGDFEVAMDFQCGFIVEPDLDLARFISTSDANYGKHKDKMVDELYEKQARASDMEERKKLVRAFEKRLLEDEAHVIWTLQWHRIIPHNAKVKGWTITPSHYLNNQLDTVWLSE